MHGTRHEHNRARTDRCAAEILPGAAMHINGTADNIVVSTQTLDLQQNPLIHVPVSRGLEQTLEQLRRVAILFGRAPIETLAKDNVNGSNA